MNETMQTMPLKIVGVGRYLPARVVSNAEVEKRCGLRAGWIEKKTGVRERRWVDGETSSEMAALAAREALDMAGILPRDVDLILNASGTPEQTIPDTAPFIQRALGLAESGIPSFSVHSTCLSFMTALDVAATLLAAGRYQKILIACADIGSAALNFEQPEGAVLFGDGAGAAVVVRTPPEESSALLAARLETYSAGANLTEIRGGGSRRHPANPATRPEDNLFHMEGPKVYRMARLHAADFLERLRPGLSQGLGSIQLVVPHQASMFAIRALRTHNMPDDRVVVTLDRFGNCVASSLPITLYEAVTQQRIQRGEELLLVGTGAGLSLGGLILRY